MTVCTAACPAMCSIHRMTLVSPPGWISGASALQPVTTTARFAASLDMSYKNKLRLSTFFDSRAVKWSQEALAC